MYLLSLIAATVWNMVDTVKSPVSTAPYTQAALEGKVDLYQVYHTGLFQCFRPNKKKLFSPFLCWSGGPPIHQQWEPQGRRNQHLGNILYLVVARLSYPMCQDVCQVLLVRWHISFVVNRPIILPGRPETRIQVTYYIPDLSLFLTMCMILSV